MLYRSILLSLLACLSTTTKAQEEYEYIVVGSGAGGGPLAARLALAGYKTLLIEAGDDQGASDNYTVPAFNLKATEDAAMSWDFFVRHSGDDARQRKDPKTSYACPGGMTYTGLDPPTGCTLKGVLYPRAATLGGCAAHNALINIYPMNSDFQNLQDLTGDASWSPENMRKYMVRLEQVLYLQSTLALVGHGVNGWLGVSHAPLNLAVDLQATSFLLGSTFTLGNWTGTPINLATALAGDQNAWNSIRDHFPAVYQVLISTKNGRRTSPRDLLRSVTDAQRPDGSKRYPLTIKLNTHVTKVTFDTPANLDPRATGVEYLEGQYLYRASKRAGQGGAGRPGSARATREVIVSGGSYNSPQILKLSGVGPRAELERFGIPVVRDLPGVGTNLQDHYEISVVGRTESNFNSLAECTFGRPGDPCLEQWRNGPRVGSIFGQAYDASGFGLAAHIKTSKSVDNNVDILALGGPAQFYGYYPGYSEVAVKEKNYWTWVVLKAHPRSKAGSVTLRSADPLDVPDINFNFFQEGGDDDLQAMYEGVNFAREAMSRQPVPVTEEKPGSGRTSRENIFQYTRENAWSHHASSTCPIGTANDPNAVLDSKFRVRGVRGLRVVDASVYPSIPGTFTALSTYLVGEKAADDILADAN